ncbi:MAG TPA: radical SAM protein [Caldimonas sp.]|nr:radical SAM protein [Caldimonas sp.]
MDQTDTTQRSILLVVLPYRLGDATTDTTKKKIRSFLAFPYGVLTLASYAQRYAQRLRGVEVLDLNLPTGESPDAILSRKLAETQPDIVGFSMSYDVSYQWLRSLSEIVKRHDETTCVVAGGPAITTAYAEILDGCPHLDAACYSEGEVGLKNLIEADDFAAVLAQDPWVTREKLARKTTAHPVYDDLDKIIDVDYSLVEIGAYSMKEAFSPFTRFVESSKQFFIVTSRGCPFKCVFCAEPSFHGANMRYASVDRVVEHVARLKHQYGLGVLTIYDDQILMNRARAKELFRKLAPLKIRIEMPNGVTLSYIDEEMAGLMKAAGVDTIFLAIEHGSKRVLKEIIKKPIAFSRIKPTVQMLQNAGIFACTFLVIGLPGETRAEREETRAAVYDWGVDWAFFNYATPLRGSELFRMCRDNVWIEEKYLPIGAIDMTDYVIRAPGMDAAEIKGTVFEMNLDLNFVNNSNLRRGNLTTAYRSFREVVSRHPGQPFAHYFLAQCMEEMGVGQARIDKHYQAYRDIIAGSDTWRAAADKFGLAPDPQAGMREERRRA